MAGVERDRDADGDGDGALLTAFLRRIRRTVDLSQRQLAAALGVDRSTIARAENGARDLPVRVLVAAARLADLRLALVEQDGGELVGMASGTVRDRAGRRFPAHLFADEVAHPRLRSVPHLDDCPCRCDIA